MVKGNNSCLRQQHSAWHPPNLNCMSSLLQPEQQYTSPFCVNPTTFGSNVAFPGFAVSGSSGLKTCQANGAHEFPWCLPPHLESSLSTPGPYFRESQSDFAFELGMKTTQHDVAGPIQKGFLIFDKFDNQTKLYFSPYCSLSQNPVGSPMRLVRACDMHYERQATIMEQISPIKLKIQEKSDEDHVIGEGSEMHEDTEEINALLYSDDVNNDHDDDSDDEDGEDDEITSTGHSPFAIEGNYEKHEQVGEIAEEVATSGGPTKRQRLLYGGYKKLSLMESTSSLKLDKSCKYDGNTELSHAKGRTRCEDLFSIFDKQQLRKDKIRETLRILKSIIPSVRSEDPLVVINEAINHLKSLKHEAEALGVGYQ